MPAFTGQLNSNEIFAAIYNMIISQEVFADNIKGTHSELVDAARVDGSLYGDQKLFYGTDVLKSRDWLNDAEASNLLAINRPAAPRVQAIVLDVFRQIDITVDYYLSKRAWGTEGAFSQFTSVILGWLRETKRVYDSTTYNAYIGTADSQAAKGKVEVDLTTALNGLSGLEKSKAEALYVAQSLADLFVELKDISRDFNDYAFLRSYADGDLKVVWSAKWVNKIRKVDLPTIFHKDGLMEFEHVLPARYFGTVITSSNASDFEYNASTNPSGPLTISNGTATVSTASGRNLVRTLVEADFTVGATTTHLFAGDALPNGATFTVASVSGLYVEDPNIICRVEHNRSVPFMSAFETGTSFFNPRSLTENHYLTWGHNTIEYLKNYPFIKVVAK